MNVDISIDNSFYHEQFPRTLILAPHPDDEINLSANLINMITLNKGEVFVAFATNGDWNASPNIRIKEARASLNMLGVKNDNIIFLGYGDSWFSCKPKHMFYTDIGYVESKAGRIQTYACEGFVDYSYICNGKHKYYNVVDFCEDLIDLISNIKPELIVCVDYDEHPDHRMLSICFERALSHVLKLNNKYRPEVLKRLAYPLAYCAASDYQLNNLSTKKPEVGDIERYKGEIIGLNNFQWEKRIRLPITPNAISNNFKRNIVARALKCHKSQYIFGRVGRILNSDEVYWRRRTDNAAYTAKIESTSGNPRYVNDFQLISTTDIFELSPVFDDYYWSPDEKDENKSISFEWDGQEVAYIKLFGNLGKQGKIECLAICFDDGFYQEVGPFPDNGAPIEVILDESHIIKKCTLTIKRFSGKEYGLAECEFYRSFCYRSCIKSFIKIISNNNFIYNYYISKKANSVKLDFYNYEVVDKEINLKVLKGESIIVNKTLVIAKRDKNIVIRADVETGNGRIYDQIVVTRVTNFFALNLIQITKIRFIEFKVFLQKNRDDLFRYIKKYGLVETMKKILNRNRL